MRTLVLGMGNPILRDDGIGLRVVDQLEGLFFDPSITLHKTTLSGMNLLDLLLGFDRAIIVDAIQTGSEPGRVFRLTPRDLSTRQATPFLHNLNLEQTLTLGNALAQTMPRDVCIVAIEVEDVTHFGETLTPAVEKALPIAVKIVLEEIREGIPPMASTPYWG